MLSHLELVRQKCDESVYDYIRRFRDTKMLMFSVNIAKKKDIADLAFSGLYRILKKD